MEELSSIVMLTDADGNEVEFEFVDLIEFEGTEYVVLFPLEDDSESEEVVILKVVTEGEDEFYEGIDDERILDAVFNIFLEREEKREE